MSFIELTAENTLDFPQVGVHLIEASAGTGKTYTVTNLYLNNIIAGKKVSEILVVTFTIAATDELRGRIRNRLYEVLQMLENGQGTNDSYLVNLATKLAQENCVDRAINYLKLAVRSMDEAAIYTIHGFCQRILNEFSFLSGQQFEMDFLNDDTDLWRQAIRDWWRKTAYPLPTATGLFFIQVLSDVNSFYRLVKPFLSTVNPLILPEPVGWDSLESSWDRMGIALNDVASKWTQKSETIKNTLLTSKGLSRAKTKPYQKDRLEAAFVRLDDYFDECLNSGAPVFPVPEFELLTRRCINDSLLKTKDEDLYDAFYDQCDSVFEIIQHLHVSLKGWSISTACSYARNKVAQVKQQTQSLSFNDLLVRLNDALTGTSGTQLATMIGQRYPVAMIDEFQDTDQLQYNIFKQIYFAHDEICLIMIGDPKQAIYSFRGGDIFTYMQVKQDIGTHHLYTLNTNWRSTPPVITAINALFSNRSSSFVYDSIPFLPAHSVDEEIKPAVYLMRNDIQQPALTIWNFPLGLYGDKNKPVSKENAAELCHQAVAEEIAALLTEAQSGTALLGDKLLQPKDIAILVRSHREAAELRQVLHKYNINAVSIEKTGVFSTDEAIGLDILLKAVLVPADRSQVRQALSSSLLNYDHIKIDSIVNNENQWLDWLDKVSSLHAVWQRKGFMPMFQRMLVYLNIEENMGGQSNAERKLTNLLHLGELIQKNSKMHPGMDALYNWFRQQREEEASDETQLRLETDEDLVQIVTIHSSKGLEYPVVFVPYLWSCRACNINEPLQFHKNNQACIDLGSEEKQQHLNLAEQERLAEDLRLTYVALTRAKSCLYLAWGMVGQGNASGKTALAYLMHPHQATESLSNHLPDAFVSGFDINDDLKQLADKSEQCICVQELKLVDSASVLKHTVHADELMARKFSGRISSHWRVNSFSALTRNIHPPGHSRVLEYNGPVSEDPVLQFPAGSHVGSFLHLILEHLDFQTDIDIQSKELSLRFAERFDIDLERYAGIISIWMQRIINTHFNSDNELCLAGIPASKRLNEMEFDLATDNVDLVRLNTLLSEAAGCDVQGIDADTFSGMVTGIIDLVFEYEGRFYIADYKSNYLGPDFSFYDHDNMTNAIYGHRYDFQFILYTLALHRYLRQRITQYDYDQHFGGAYYLFLRGMHPESGSQQGIYFNKPELSLINKLDKEIFLPEGVLA